LSLPHLSQHCPPHHFSQSAARQVFRHRPRITEDELDLNAYCIRRPSATFFVRAIGDSMKDMGLHSGDLMVVDKAEKPMQGDIVIAETDGEFTVKRLQLKPRIALLPMNPAYPTLYPEELQIFGVVMAFIHKTRGTN
jgi:DNA polymerase V